MIEHSLHVRGMGIGFVILELWGNQMIEDSLHVRNRFCDARIVGM